MSDSSQDSEGPSVHYIFAHYALRGIALASPLEILSILASPDAEKFLSGLLEDVVEKSGREAGFVASDVTVHPTRIGEYPCAVIELPEPQETAEAFMVAIVALVAVPFQEPPDPEAIEGRFLTLEKSFSLDGDAGTVLAEWDSDRHINYGEGPEPTVDAFIAAVAEKAFT